MIAAAKRASIPVVVHFDHGLTAERCLEALELGFSSIMFDGSAGDESENLKRTQKMVKTAYAFGATVEGEVGHVGEVSNRDNEASDMYTTPEQAINFVRETGVDALAIAIGTAHGIYKTKPKLDLNRLTDIRAALDTPLVLHGGSGLSDDDFGNTIKNGITKINIFQDVCIAGEKGMKDAEGQGYLKIREKKVEYIKRTVMEKLMLFGSNGRV